MMEIENPHLLPKVRSEALTKAIAGMPCSLRLSSIAGLSCSPRSTVVGCHLPTFGQGTATKVTDLAVAAGCWQCHELLDKRNAIGREASHRYPTAWAMRLLDGLVETQARLVMAGVIEVRGARLTK